MSTQALTLADYGVVHMDLSRPQEAIPEYPVCIVIKDCHSADEMQEILEINKRTHPDDKIWICAGPGNTIRVGREK